MFKSINPEHKNEILKDLNFFDNLKLKDDNSMDKQSAVNFYKTLDTNFESFFYKRQINVKNYNYFLQVLARQNKPEEAHSHLQRMPNLGLSPNSDSYNQVLLAYSRVKDIVKAEEIINEAKAESIHESKYIYNSLLLAYTKNCRTSEAEAIIREMEKIGMQPNSVCYTTLIHAYNRKGEIGKC